MSDDINTSMQRERLAGAAAKSEQSDRYRDANADELMAAGFSDPWSVSAIFDTKTGTVLGALGEPEDRSWYRDGKDVLKLLNELSQQLAAAKAELEAALGILNDSLPSGRGQNIADVAVNVVNELCAAKADSIALRAWHSQFGTSQLSHAIAERDASKAENAESIARIAGLQARVDQYQQERSDAIDELAQLRAENAELRKRPTMELLVDWLVSLRKYGMQAQPFASLHDPNIGLAAFIEQQRRNGG